MLQRLLRTLSPALLVCACAILSTLILQSAPRQVSGAGAVSPTVRHTTLDVNCISAPTFTATYTKIADFGDFTVVNGESVVEVTFNGRIDVDSLTGNGAIFELRVDDEPSPLGRARATLKQSEATGIAGVPASMTGIFPSLVPGEHTVSLWVRAGGGASPAGTGGRVDPGCWQSDHIVVREYAPFGTTFLPHAGNN